VVEIRQDPAMAWKWVACIKRIGRLWC